MKVAFINQPWSFAVIPVQYADSIGIWIYEVSHLLARSCEVICYARKGRSQKQIEYHKGLQYRRVFLAFDRLSRPLRLLDKWKFLNSKRPFFASSLYYLSYILQIAIDLRKQQCEVVHIHNFSQFIPIIRAFNPKIKIVLHMHCEWLTQLDRTMIERRLYKADLIIGCSDYITHKIRLSFPEIANRCQTIFNGVNIEQFISNNNRQNVYKENEAIKLLFVGRVAPEKGVHILLDAFQKVTDYYPQTRLEIVGPKKMIVSKEFIDPANKDSKVSALASLMASRGTYLSYLQERISPDKAEQVSFTGFVPHTQLVTYYQDADVFIFPSVWNEPFGIPLVEAMATGVPLVATRSGAFPEIVEEGKTGLLVERDNSSELAEAILQLLSDENLRKSMGRAGRQRVVEMFSWETISENLLCQYKSICKDHDGISPENSII